MAWRLRNSLRREGVFAAMLLLGCFVRGQVGFAGVVGGSQTVADVLEQMSGRADVIFVGQVLAVRRVSGASGGASFGASGVVEVNFRVDRAVRGCSAGLYTMREWAGLWALDDQRYHIGQRVLMLLHAPSAAGMSSPVDGLDGAIPIRQGGSATPYTDSAKSVPFVDLRWLGAKLPRAVSYRVERASRAGNGLPPVPYVAQAQMAVSSRAGGAVNGVTVAPGSGNAGGGSVPEQQASVEAVIGMLTTWEKARHVAAP